MFTISVATDNAAFDEYPQTEVARILDRAANTVAAGFRPGGTVNIRDINGNTVGAMTWVDDDYGLDPMLRLSFTPNAIREHYEDDDSETARKVHAMTDAQLARAGQAALCDDTLYRAFDYVLEVALTSDDS